MRSLAAEEIAAFGEVVVRPFIAATMEFASGTVRMWTGVGPLVMDGETFMGGGNFIRVSSVRETQAFDSNNVTLQLSGIPPEIAALALGERCKGRPITLWLGRLSEAGQVAGTPFILFRGDMDSMPIEDAGDRATVSLVCESRAARLKHASNRRYTHADQQIEFPDDMALEYIDQLQNKDVQWKPTK